jgi:simple sugar transport system permease protein
MGTVKKKISLINPVSSELGIIYPLLAFIAILLFNLVFTEGFFHIEIKNGHLFGSLIDIFNRGAPVILVTIGMTLVYATAVLTSLSGQSLLYQAPLQRSLSGLIMLKASLNMVIRPL